MTARSGGVDDRRTWLAFAVALMIAGLAWRLAPLGLPVFWLRYGGGALWGAMIFCLVAMARPSRFGRFACVAVASAIVIGAEAFRLYHAPALDAFRDTLAGALLLGKVFSPTNVVAYEFGVIAATVGLWRQPSLL